MWTPRSRRLMLGIFPAVVGLPYLLLGPGYFLDDFYSLSLARFEGAWAAAGPQQPTARPGAWLTYAFVFGLLGGHPALTYVFQLAVAGVTAVLLCELIGHYFRTTTAFMVSALWVVLPNHQTLTIWASATNIAISLLLLVAGLLALARFDSARRAVTIGAPLLGLSVLFYEATAPTALAVLLCMAFSRREQEFLRLAVPVAAVLSACIWIVTHWHPDKSAQPFADLTQLSWAHLGRGIVGIGEPVLPVLLGTVAVVGLVLIVYRHRKQTDDSDHEPFTLLCVAALLIATGTAPFLWYFFSPIGFGDRVNVVTGVGTAMIWVALISSLRELRRLPVVVGVVFACLVLATNVQRQSLYAATADDVRAVLRLAEDRRYPGDQAIAIGPCLPQKDNVVGLLDPSNVEGALRLSLDQRDVRGFLIQDREAFAAFDPSRRIDVRDAGIACP